MNSDKHPGAGTNRGNAVIYVLLTLALLGALTALITRQGDQANGESLDTETTLLLTTKTMAYSGSVKGIVDQMTMSGTLANNLNIVRPNQTSFDTAPHINKIFHPDGGGMTFEPATDQLFEGMTATPAGGWYISKTSNIEWTPTTATDVVVTAYRILRPVCEEINFRITGSRTIPALSTSMASIFIDTADGGLGTSLTSANCPGCVGYPTLCVSNSGATNFSYYNIIVAR